MEDSQEVIRRKVSKQLEQQLQESLASYQTGSKELIEALEEIEAKANPLIARICAQLGGSAIISTSKYENGLAAQVATRLLPSGAFFGGAGGSGSNSHPAALGQLG